jgi:hypothetical protein
MDSGAYQISKIGAQADYGCGSACTLTSVMLALYCLYSKGREAQLMTEWLKVSCWMFARHAGQIAQAHSVLPGQVAEFLAPREAVQLFEPARSALEVVEEAAGAWRPEGVPREMLQTGSVRLLARLLRRAFFLALDEPVALVLVTGSGYSCTIALRWHASIDPSSRRDLRKRLVSLKPAEPDWLRENPYLSELDCALSPLLPGDLLHIDFIDTHRNSPLGLPAPQGTGVWIRFRSLYWFHQLLLQRYGVGQPNHFDLVLLRATGPAANLATIDKIRKDREFIRWASEQEAAVYYHRL